MAEDQEPRDRADLLLRMESSWTALHALIDGTDPVRLTDVRDPERWSVKDHLSHLAAWERSVVYPLQGRPRHEGLGVEEQLYLQPDFDEINASIYAQTKDHTLDEALADLRGTHEQLLALIDRLSDTDLQQPYSHFLPEESGADSGETIVLTLAAIGTYEHYDEHRPWMEALVSRDV